jgi:outer membrane protein OmpA-like peptidoglycan-associated protein
MKRLIIAVLALSLFFTDLSFAYQRELRQKKQKEALAELQKEFAWWPTDATPAPVKDEKNQGYWWWPNKPGKAQPLWGNRGYVYVYRILFDYKAEELPAPKPQEPRPSLLIKKIIRNVKIYFDFDKASLRSDAIVILEDAVKALKKYPETDILVTGNCDARGSEKYNLKLGRQRAEAVKKFMLKEGVEESRIRIVSRGKLDAVAPVTDLQGMQKERNAQFMVAEVEEVMIPYPEKMLPSEAKAVEEGKYIAEKEEKIESAPKVSTKEYIVKKGDTLSKIAKEQYGKEGRWKYIYELNKDKIKDPNKLRPGQKILIPVE